MLQMLCSGAKVKRHKKHFIVIQGSFHTGNQGKTGKVRSCFPVRENSRNLINLKKSANLINLTNFQGKIREFKYLQNRNKICIHIS